MTGEGFGRVEAEYWLWHYGHGGMEPGDFFKHLLEAVVRADPPNRALMARGFPEVVAAFEFCHANPISAVKARGYPRPSDAR